MASRRLHGRTQANTDFHVPTVFNQTLLILEQVGDIADVPGLKGAAGVLRVISDICNSASQNKAEWKALGDDVGQLALAMAGQIEEHKDHLQDLRDQISQVCRRLEAVHTSLQELRDRTRVAWISNHTRDEEILSRLRGDVKDALDLFFLEISIRLGQTARRNAENAELNSALIRDSIKDVCQAVLDRIKKDPVDDYNATARPPEGPVLPRQQLTFFGRQKETDALSTTLVSRRNVRAVVLGAAGIGKTSLISKVLRDARISDFFQDRRYFVPCDGTLGKDDLLTAIGNVIGVQGGRLEKRILDRFGQLQLPLLVVLDNFEDCWEPIQSREDVENFLARLTSVGNVSLVLTMRGSERPSKIAWTLPPLPVLASLDISSARKTFLSIANCTIDDSDVDNLLLAVDCVPLAVMLMGTLAQTDSPTLLLQRWQSERSSLLYRADNKGDSLDMSIRLSLDSPRMRTQPEALQLLGLLSLLPDGVDHRNFEAIFPTFKLPKRALSVLWQNALAYHDGKNRTRVLSPIRAYMDVYHLLDQRHLLAMMTFYMGFARLSQNLGGEHGQEIVKRLSPEIGNLHAVLNLALRRPDLDDTVKQSAIEATIDLSRFNRYSYLGNRDTLLLASALVKKMDNTPLQADVTFHLAWSLVENTVEAETLCRTALHLYEACGNVFGQAECNFLFGQIFKATKREESKAFYQNGISLASRSGNTYCQAKCLSALGEMAKYDGDISGCEKYCHESLRLFRELNSLTNIGLILHLLGRLESKKSNHDAALRHFEESVTVLDRAGAFQHAVLPMIAIGDLLSARCSFAAALKLYKDGLQKGFLNPAYAAYSKLSIAEAAAALYDRETAIQYVDEAKTFFAAGSSDVYGLLHCYFVYGDLEMDKEPPNFTDSQNSYHKALDLARKGKYKEPEAKCHIKLGILHGQRGDTVNARRFLTLGLAMYEKMADLKGKANMLTRLGGVCRTEGDQETAKSLFRAMLPVCWRVEQIRGVAMCWAGIGEILESRLHIEEAIRLYAGTGDTKSTERLGQGI